MDASWIRSPTKLRPGFCFPDLQVPDFSEIPFFPEKKKRENPPIHNGQSTYPPPTELRLDWGFIKTIAIPFIRFLSNSYFFRGYYVRGAGSGWLAIFIHHLQTPHWSSIRLRQLRDPQDPHQQSLMLKTKLVQHKPKAMPPVETRKAPKKTLMVHFCLANKNRNIKELQFELVPQERRLSQLTTKSGIHINA